jgi:hypothetical protein
MARIKIKDLSVDLQELQKKDPEILSKIRGGAISGSRLIARVPIGESTVFMCLPVPRPDSKTGTTLCDTTNFGCA